MYLTLPGRMHADLKKDCHQFPGFLAAAAFDRFSHNVLLYAV